MHIRGERGLTNVVCDCVLDRGPHPHVRNCPVANIRRGRDQLTITNFLDKTLTSVPRPQPRALSGFH
ncbi:hypothetical protein J6590_034763 [Homalodisca vitripennis]|nr:hypothetical protein J6590_034763 [Homalodisca vitripennis]